MNYIQLKEVCDLDNGYAFKSDSYVEESNTLNCRMSNIRPNGSFDIFYNAKYLPDEFADKYKNYLLNDGDLIIAMTDMAGDPKILGVPTVVDTKGKKLLLNQRVGKLRFIDSKYELNTDYLKISLQAPYVRTYFKQYSGGGVQLNVGKKEILNAKIVYRDIKEQIEIVNIFKAINKLISIQNEKINNFDELIKARFVEMFGDRWNNDKNWQTKELKEITDFHNGRAHEKVIDENGKYILITSKCIASDMNDYRKTNSLLYPLKINDICMVMSDVPNGRAIGKCLLINENDKYTLNQRICCFDNYALNPIFFQQLLNRHEYFLSFDTGQDQTNLRKEDILKCPIMLPPINLQNEFASFYKQIDKSKFIVQKKIEKYQELMDKLMDEYFGDSE